MSNTLTNIMPKILARGLLALREQAVMARLVNVDYGTESRQKGQTIDIPVSKPKTATDVTPGPVPASASNSAPGLIQMTLDNWKKADFYLTDKEAVEIDQNAHFVPMEAQEAIKALANTVTLDIYGEYKGVYGWVGQADGSTAVDPFASSITDATDARKVLNTQLAPIDMRRIVLDPSGEANALGLPQLSDFDKIGEQRPRIEGELGRKMGMDWYMDQLVPTHTKGTAATITFGSTIAAGASTIELNASTAGTLQLGDVFTIAGDTQTYVATATATLTSGGKVAVNIRPALQATASTGDAVTVKASHKVNLAFHRDAFAFANRPLTTAGAGADLGSVFLSQTDPVTGLSLRLEVSRQYKQVVWEFDVLWGTKLIRPEFAARIAGAL